MSDEDNSEPKFVIGETRDYKPEDKRVKSLLLFIPLVFVAIVVAALFITYTNSLEEPGIEIIDYVDEDILRLTVVNAPPYARDSTGIDNVGGKISHTLPTTQEIIRTLVWANTETNSTRLMELESELMNAAELNDGKISLGERYFLDIITYSAYPEFCNEDPDNEQCEFFTILYNQGLYQDGVIDRNEYWLAVKQYASPETIAEVESQDLT